MGDSDLHEASRQVLLRLVEKRFEGSQKRFALAAGLTPSYVSRMLNPAGAPSGKRIGEDMARKLEDAPELGRRKFTLRC